MYYKNICLDSTIRGSEEMEVDQGLNSLDLSWKLIEEICKESMSKKLLYQVKLLIDKSVKDEIISIQYKEWLYNQFLLP